MIAQSVVQMTRSTNFVYCALLAICFLKARLYRHHWSSMVVILSGVALVGIGYLMKGKDEAISASKQLAGLGLLQLGQLFGAVGFVAEEKFLGDCEELDPMLMVGFEGLAGFILWLILLPIFNFVPCTSEELCDEKNGVIESSIAAF